MDNLPTMKNLNEKKSQTHELLASVRAAVAQSFPQVMEQMTATVSPTEPELPALIVTLPNGHTLLVGADLDREQRVCLVADISDEEDEPYNNHGGYDPELTAAFIVRYLNELREQGVPV